jgi:predicted kinase
VLIIIGGLPAAGKTTIARALAREIGAAHLRIDTIEQAIVRSGGGSHPLGPVGYSVGYAVAEDQLRLGLTVIAESVNPLEVTRSAWRAVAERTGHSAVEIEVVCSDETEHRRRATTRTIDIEDLVGPTWQQILDREYEPWVGEHMVVDTAGRSLDSCVAQVRQEITRTT